MLCCEAIGGVSGNVLLERSEGFDVGDWGILKLTLGVWNFLFRLGYMICLFISSVFWFWLICLTLLRSCCRRGYMLYVGSYCGSYCGQLILMVQIIVRAFLQRCRIVLERNACWWLGILGICLCCWMFLGGCLWGLVWGCWLALLEKFLSF